MTVMQSLRNEPLAGFGNLFNRESRKWWHTRRWWMQTIIWAGILIGFTVFGLFVMPTIVDQANAEAGNTGSATMTGEEFRQDVPNALMGLAVFFLPVGVIILTHSQVYGEKQSGVAAWILSKPVSRQAYLMAKFVADLIGILLIMVLLPLGVSYVITSQEIEVGSEYLLAMGLVVLLVIFYQSFTLMMSVLGQSSEVVLGVSMGMLLTGMILKGVLTKVLGDLIFATPWMLPDAIGIVVQGNTLPDNMYITLGSVPVLVLICLGVMTWQFQHQEL
jgi:ABC-2 type transport system permease protein